MGCAPAVEADLLFTMTYRTTLTTYGTEDCLFEFGRGFSPRRKIERLVRGSKPCDQREKSSDDFSAKVFISPH